MRSNHLSLTKVIFSCILMILIVPAAYGTSWGTDVPVKPALAIKDYVTGYSYRTPLYPNMSSLAQTSQVQTIHYAASSVSYETDICVIDETAQKPARFATTLSSIAPLPAPSPTIEIHTTGGTIQGAPQMIFDKDTSTSVTVPVKPGNSDSVTTITIRYNQPVTRNIVSLAFAGINLPQGLYQFQVAAKNTQGEFQVLSKSTVHTLRPFNDFPTYTAREWIIIINHSRAFSMMEIDLVDSTSPPTTNQTEISFVVDPGHIYALYTTHDSTSSGCWSSGPVPSPNGSLLQPITLAESSHLPNPHLNSIDHDNDGVPDKQDNCIYDTNPDQADKNQNGIGDICDDHDLDSMKNASDNCPDVFNPGQKDRDQDRVGDACDSTDDRFDYQYPWLPWLGILVGFVVVIGIHTTTQKSDIDTVPPDMTHT
jgi:hypothetical protein